MIDNINKTKIAQETVDDTTQEGTPKGKAQKKGGKRIGYNYIILKSLKESKKNDVVKCLYIHSLLDFGVCVIKEGTYGDTMDKFGRDIKDRLTWQKELHNSLQDKIRIPRLLGSFEENGNFYLVIERIKGKSLYDILRKRKTILREQLIKGSNIGLKHISLLTQIIDLLGKFHALQIVHRDVTANNFIVMPNGKIAVIDLELSYSIQKDFPSPPFQLGTRGYMSPEQESALTPTVKEDIFSIGALILQFWAGITPRKLTKTGYKSIQRKIDFIIPDAEISAITKLCLHPDPQQRPSAEEISDKLKKYCQDRKHNVKRLSTHSLPYSKDEILNTVQQTISTLASPLLMDPEKGWFAETLNIPSSLEKNKISKSWYGSFSKGVAGILYFLAIAKNAGLDVSLCNEGIQKGMDLLEKKYNVGYELTSGGLHSGTDGVAATIAIALDYQLIPYCDHYPQWIQKLLNKPITGWDFANGWAGKGMAAMHCATYLQQEILQERLGMCIANILSAQHHDGSWLVKNKARLGFHNGVAGIISYLISFGKRYNHEGALHAAESGLRWLTQKCHVKNGNYIWKASNGSPLVPNFCNGTVGIGFAYLKAFEYFGDTEYKKYAVGAMNNLPPRIIQSSLGQCHGLSSCGETYLEAFRILKDEIWLERATHIAQLTLHLKSEHPLHGPCWLVENEVQPIANFMAGNSGVLHFLLRYCKQDIIHSPLAYGDSLIKDRLPILLTQ